MGLSSLFEVNAPLWWPSSTVTGGDPRLTRRSSESRAPRTKVPMTKESRSGSWQTQSFWPDCVIAGRPADLDSIPQGARDDGAAQRLGRGVPGRQPATVGYRPAAASVRPPGGQRPAWGAGGRRRLPGQGEIG